MKKLAILFCLITGVFAFSAFTCNSDVNGKSIESSASIQQLGQYQTVDAYRMAGGNWQNGTITYQSTAQGFRPISYDFSAYRGGGGGQFMPDERFAPLNPNNELAKKKQLDAYDQFNGWHTLPYALLKDKKSA
jgi:hypothetical protein